MTTTTQQVVAILNEVLDQATLESVTNSLFQYMVEKDELDDAGKLNYQQQCRLRVARRIFQEL